MKERILQFLCKEEGLTTVEYAVAGALISVAIVGAFTALGDEVARVIAFIAGAISII
jgi:pilus assembly protein Flp/PilA